MRPLYIKVTSQRNIAHTWRSTKCKMTHSNFIHKLKSTDSSYSEHCETLKVKVNGGVKEKQCLHCLLNKLTVLVLKSVICVSIALPRTPHNFRAVTNYNEKYDNSFQTKRPLSTGIFSLKITHQHGFKPTTSCLPGRRTTNWAKVTKLGANW